MATLIFMLAHSWRNEGITNGGASPFLCCGCAMMRPMTLLRKRLGLLESLEDRLRKSLARIPSLAELGREADRSPLSNIVVTAAWVAGGLGVVTLGLLAGRELRGRYKIKRRTPYDYYAHSGDRSPDLDYSVGI